MKKGYENSPLEQGQKKSTGVLIKKPCVLKSGEVKVRAQLVKVKVGREEMKVNM